jgi:adenine phosphoribosyltransferase
MGMNSAELAAYLKPKIRAVPDWPKPGVKFRDITPLFRDPAAFHEAIEAFATDCSEMRADLLAAVDARGFILGGALAHRMGKPFALVRKKGKLPGVTVSAEYELEYGTASVEIHADSCRPGERTLIVDDLIATGGTLLAAAKLIRSLGAQVVGVAALVNLPELGGSRRLVQAGIPVHALCSFTLDE